MANRTVPAEFVYQLAEYGVKMIFGITGDALNGFTDAIRKDGRIEWFTVRHEETAAFAAAAQAELTGKLAVCVGTVGPGALHLINGLYNAKRDYSPVLAITGQVPREEIGSRYFQEVDQDKVFDDACIFNETLQSAEQLPRILQQAIEAALLHGGVAHIAIPTDLAVSEMPYKTQPIQIFMPSQPAVPSDAEIDQMAALINQSSQPALLIGCGCRDAADSVIALAEKIQSPIAHSLKGSEVLSYHQPLSIGGVGHVGTPHGMHTIEKCDLLIMLGTDFPYRAFLPDHGNIIQIDKRAENVGHRCPVKIGAVGDAAATIKKLLPKLKQKQPSDFLKKLQEKRDRWVQQTDEKYALKGKVIHPQSVVLTVAKLANEDAIFVGEVGEVTVWIARYLQMTGKQRLIGSFNHGSLGVGLPAAIGAQALDRSRQVIALCGDGAFGMLLGDLVTAARYQLPLIAIVFNNSKFGFVELEMEAAGMARFATDLLNPDFVKIAEASGCVGISVTAIEQLEPALKQALSSKKPVLVDVMVNPTELIIPSSIDIKMAWKFTQGKVREVLVEGSIKPLFER